MACVWVASPQTIQPSCCMSTIRYAHVVMLPNHYALHSPLAASLIIRYPFIALYDRQYGMV
jgi:hypothetical protein